LAAALSDGEFARLLGSIRAGDEQELGRLLEIFRPLLSRIAEDRIGTKVRVRFSGSDLVQETLLAASMKIAAFRGQSPQEFQSWLVEILRARLNDGLRRHLLAERRRVSAQRSGKSGLLETKLQSPSTQAVLNEQSAALIAAIASLDDLDREIVFLRYIDHLSFEEISARVDIPLSTVWRRWHNAIKLLRIRLEHG
jgi:RNA polymerase sigma-70 factor (ECF subfamily)